MDREKVSVQPSLLGALFGWILVGHARRQRHRDEAVLLDIQRRHEQEMLSEHQQHEEDMLRARDPEAAARLDLIKAQRAKQLAEAAAVAAKRGATVFVAIVLIVVVAAATLIYVSTPEPVEPLPARPTVPAAAEAPAAAVPASTPEPVEPSPVTTPVPTVDELWTLTGDADVLRDMDSFVLIATVHKGRPLRVIGRSRHGGFLHVRLHDGREGWVDAEKAQFVANWIDDPASAAK